MLLTLTRSGVVDLIGRQWFFVRVHDAVQVCLQHVQSLNDTPRSESPLHENKPSIFKRLSKQRQEELSLSELESGNKEIPTSKDDDTSHLEPLLSKKHWGSIAWIFFFFFFMYVKLCPILCKYIMIRCFMYVCTHWFVVLMGPTIQIVHAERIQIHIEFLK